MSGKFTLKYIITLYCEMIWLYFALIVWSKLEWEIETSPPMLLFIIPSVLAVLLYFGTKKLIRNFYVQYSAILILFLVYIYFLWNQVAPYGGLAYEIMACALAFHLFLRSLYFLNKEPKRLQMLLRFEGNIFLYLFYVLFFHTNPELLTINLHVYFFAAILLSLVGMVLTLYPDENKDEDDEDVEIRKAGDVGWLPYAVISIFLLVFGIGFLLLLPGVRSFVVSSLSNGWSLIVKMGGLLQSALIWLLSLFPTPEGGGPIEMEPGSGPLAGQAQEELPLLQVPFFEILVVILAVSILVGLWFLLKGIKKGNRPIRVKQRRTAINRTKTIGFLGWILALLKKGYENLARNFPFYYEFPAYWEYHKLEKWGKKQGYPRLSTETPHEYVNRLTQSVLFAENEKVKTRYTIESVFKVTDEYTAAYYGKRKSG